MNAATERRIAALEPGRYTRMGAAIRHTAAELCQRANRHRLLLVLSDGKPSDSDYYEGRYAIEDTRRAIDQHVFFRRIRQFGTGGVLDGFRFRQR